MKSKGLKMLHYGAPKISARAAVFFKTKGLDATKGDGIGVLYVDMNQPGADEILANYRKILPKQ